MPKGMVVGEYTIAFEHVQKTEASWDGSLMVWCGDDYLEIKDKESASKFQSAFLRYLGIEVSDAFANEQGEVPF